jgi:hypothetical protein
MVNEAKKLAVLARNYAVYKQHAFWAARATDHFPLDSSSNFVISVASYPKRLHQVPAVFESLARQKVRARRAYLVLSEEEFPSRIVPAYIDKLAHRGIEIIWTKGNTFAVKVIVPVWGRDLGAAICPFDDDFIYGPHVLERLSIAAKKNPGSIIGFSGKALYRVGERIAMRQRQSSEPNERTPSAEIYFLKGLGTWYPPDSLSPLFVNVERINQIVPGRGADIWLWAAAHAAGTKQVCISSQKARGMWIPIPETRTTGPKDAPGGDVLEERFQKAIDYFGIREKLLRDLPDYEAGT